MSDEQRTTCNERQSVSACRPGHRQSPSSPDKAGASAMASSDGSRPTSNERRVAEVGGSGGNPRIRRTLVVHRHLRPVCLRRTRNEVVPPGPTASADLENPRRFFALKCLNFIKKLRKINENRGVSCRRWWIEDFHQGGSVSSLLECLLSRIATLGWCLRLGKQGVKQRVFTELSHAWGTPRRFGTAS